MMIPSFQSDSVQLPYVVSLLGALHSHEITAKEYYSACHVAVLEDSSRKLFYKTTWAKVEAGDIVLMGWGAGEIVEVVISNIRVEPSRVTFNHWAMVRFDKDGKPYSERAFDPDSTVYVRSRF